MSNEPMWVKCPECGHVTRDTEWREVEFGCETCGGHSGHECPNTDCGFSFDSVYTDFNKIAAPPSLLELMAIAFDEGEKQDAKDAEERAQAAARRAKEEEGEGRFDGGFIFWRPTR